MNEETPFEILLDKELHEILERGIACLTPREQFAIRGRFEQDMTYAEVGSFLISRTTQRPFKGPQRTRQITYVALNKLRRFLQKTYAE